MADYFTHFSCLLDVGTPERAARAIDFFAALRDDDDKSEEPQFHGFDLSLQDGQKSGVLWIHDDESGDVEAVTDIEAATAWGKLPAGNTVEIGDPLFPRLDMDAIDLSME